MKTAIHPKRPTASLPVRVLVVDDHPAVRAGLMLLLAAEDIVVCGEVAGRADALAQVEKSRPDVAIVDLSLEGEDGRALIADLQRRSVPVLVYSMHSDSGHVTSALAAGALGYVTKRAAHGVLVEGIREVAAGHRFLSPAAANALAQSVTDSAADDGIGKLSEHERKVYELLGQGVDTFDIAAALHISTHTVESYYARMIVKLNVNGMRELRRQAINQCRKHTQ